MVKLKKKQKELNIKLVQVFLLSVKDILDDFNKNIMEISDLVDTLHNGLHASSDHQVSPFLHELPGPVDGQVIALIEFLELEIDQKLNEVNFDIVHFIVHLLSSKLRHHRDKTVLL